VSHLLERTEKDCLNCGTTVYGRYCHVCGQENIEPKESAWHLITHFFNDFTHFDGKFFSTLKDLLFKPGFLPKEYMRGRRAAYLNPIRMYIFTSFIFFLIFFSTFQINEGSIDSPRVFNGKTVEQINNLNEKDFEDFTKEINGKPMTRAGFQDSIKHLGGLHFTDNNYKSKAEYDSLLKSGVKKHNWFERKIIYKEIELNEKNKNDESQIMPTLIESLVHHFPQMLFISLPFMALFLKLLYIRNKNFYYVSHAIFVLHLYIFFFIALLLSVGISGLRGFTSWSWLNYINGAISIIVFFYLYKAMRNFYQQRRKKTIFKYFLFLFFFLFLTVLLFLIFFFISFFQV
jgi:hypothetical protein